MTIRAIENLTLGYLLPIFYLLLCYIGIKPLLTCFSFKYLLTNYSSCFSLVNSTYRKAVSLCTFANLFTRLKVHLISELTIRIRLLSCFYWFRKFLQDFIFCYLGQIIFLIYYMGRTAAFLEQKFSFFIYGMFKSFLSYWFFTDCMDSTFFLWLYWVFVPYVHSMRVVLYAVLL